jgi:hypothetical protein
MGKKVSDRVIRGSNDWCWVIEIGMRGSLVEINIIYAIETSVKLCANFLVLTGRAAEINLYLTALGQARQLIETYST